MIAFLLLNELKNIFSFKFIMQTIGTRAQVWHGNAKKTSGGLTKSHLMMNKHGRIVSRRKHASGKKTIKHLRSLGYVAKKGEFKLFHKGHKGHKSRKMRGGMGPMGNGSMGNSGTGSSGTTGTGSGNSGTLATAMVADKMMNSGSGSGSGNGSGPMSSGKGPMGGKMTGGRRRMRGGMAYGGPLSPHSYDGQGVGTSGVALQFVAGNA